MVFRSLDIGVIYSIKWIFHNGRNGKQNHLDPVSGVLEDTKIPSDRLQVLLTSEPSPDPTQTYLKGIMLSGSS